MSALSALIKTIEGPSRRAVQDPRDLHHLLADGPLPPVAKPLIRGPVYDQGEAPTAVACALLAALHAAPIRIGPSRCPSVEELDRKAREIEGALGPAVTLRSGCKALKELGLITGYRWTYEPFEAAAWLATNRGMVLGLDWYARMDRPDQTGLIRAWRAPSGGHAVFAFHYDQISDTFWIQNSRGEDWGGWTIRQGRRDYKGCARLPREDLAKLFRDNAEGVILEKNPDWDHRRVAVS